MFVNWEANDPESGIRICEWAVGKWVFYREFKCIYLFMYLVFPCPSIFIDSRNFDPLNFGTISKTSIS